MTIGPTERFAVACPSREDILEREAVVSQALGAVALHPGVFIPCATADGQCVAAENSAHPVMKCTKPHVAGQRSQITLFFERRIDAEGPRLTTEIVEASPEELRVGMRMRPVLGAAPDGDVTMLRFAPDWSGG